MQLMFNFRFNINLSENMPVGNRRYENVLQSIFGLGICIILLQCLFNCLVMFWQHITQ